MKQKILPLLLFAACVVSANNFIAAQTNRAFAVTGDVIGSANWTVFREIDLSTGTLLRNIYIPSAGQNVLYDALSGIQISADDKNLLQDKSSSVLPNLNTQMVAALAYDAKYNRLYFTPMKSAELRYIDLNSSTPKVFAVKYQSLKPYETRAGETDIITRMAFASDGYGYALTNSGEHLLRFSTGQKVEITDLGNLKEGVNNNEKNTIHGTTDTWGGDMIGDAFGNLYLFTMRGNIFKINPQTLVADFQGTIKNLPQGFNVNAVAVDASGDAIISSAIDATAYYRVNLKTFEAAALPKKNANDKVYNASDFANANLAFSSDKKVNIPKANGTVTIYPNPAVNKNFTVETDGFIKNNYRMELTDMSGKKILTRTVSVDGKQNEKIILPAKTVSGVYILRITDAEGQNIFTDKIVVN